MEGVYPDEHRERKRLRDDSEPTEEEEPGMVMDAISSLYTEPH